MKPRHRSCGAPAAGSHDDPDHGPWPGHRREGKPVAGATIYLVSTKGRHPARHDDHRPRRLVHLPKYSPSCLSQREDAPLAGTFQVYGTAPGLASPGTACDFINPAPPRRLEDRGRRLSPLRGRPEGHGPAFPPAATLSGRIVDETGRPVPDARIRIGAEA